MLIQKYSLVKLKDVALHDQQNVSDLHHHVVNVKRRVLDVMERDITRLWSIINTLDLRTANFFI